ncbi:MAG: AI-2E family transporter [Erysipelotrichaceae bacterium]
MKSETLIGKLTVKNILVIITYTVFLVLCVMNWKTIWGMVAMLLKVLAPFLIGLGLAFVFNIPMRYIEQKLPERITKYRKILSAILAMFIIVGLLILLINIIVPQIAASIALFIKELPTYIASAKDLFYTVVEQLNLAQPSLNSVIAYLNALESDLINILSTLLPYIISIAGNLTVSVVNVFIGLVISIYLIISKEQLLSQFDKLLYAFLQSNHYEYFHHVRRQANEIFSGFIAGQLTEALIVGVLCYLGCLILQIPYAPILGVIIGLTNIIPIFGPIFGTIPGALLILIIDPIKAIIFVVFVIILQQVESNLIYPRVVGSNIGLSPIWVLLGITLGGGLFGLIGIILGIPVVALVYRLLADEVRRRIALKQKLLELGEENEGC